MPDIPRLLHKRSHHGYTTDPAKAMFGEPEAVSADAQRAITAQAHDHAHQLQVAKWIEARADIQRRLDWVWSQRFRRDVQSQVRALERQLQRLDQRIAS